MDHGDVEAASRNFNHSTADSVTSTKNRPVLYKFPAMDRLTDTHTTHTNYIRKEESQKEFGDHSHNLGTWTPVRLQSRAGKNTIAGPPAAG